MGEPLSDPRSRYSSAGTTRYGAAAIALSVALSSAACASSGAVPRPFPAPAGASPSTSSPARHGVDAETIASTALSMRGVPYRNGGADPSGFDCSGFTRWVYGQHGILLPRDTREQYQIGRKVKLKQLAPGDLVFFSTVARGASHVAIALGGDSFIHAPSSAGVVRVERLTATYWSRRVLGARRVNGG